MAFLVFCFNLIVLSSFVFLYTVNICSVVWAYRCNLVCEEDVHISVMLFVSS